MHSPVSAVSPTGVGWVLLAHPAESAGGCGGGWARGGSAQSGEPGMSRVGTGLRDVRGVPCQRQGSCVGTAWLFPGICPCCGCLSSRWVGLAALGGGWRIRTSYLLWTGDGDRSSHWCCPLPRSVLTAGAGNSPIAQP